MKLVSIPLPIPTLAAPSHTYLATYLPSLTCLLSHLAGPENKRALSPPRPILVYCSAADYCSHCSAEMTRRRLERAGHWLPTVPTHGLERMRTFMDDSVSYSATLSHLFDMTLTSTFKDTPQGPTTIMDNFPTQITPPHDELAVATAQGEAAEMAAPEPAVGADTKNSSASFPLSSQVICESPANVSEPDDVEYVVMKLTPADKAKVAKM